MSNEQTLDEQLKHFPYILRALKIIKMEHYGNLVQLHPNYDDGIDGDWPIDDIEHSLSTLKPEQLVDICLGDEGYKTLHKEAFSFLEDVYDQWEDEYWNPRYRNIRKDPKCKWRELLLAIAKGYQGWEGEEADLYTPKMMAMG